MSQATIDWLLEPSNASARWLTLRLLFDKPNDDSDVVATRAAIPSSPWARKVLRDQHPA